MIAIIVVVIVVPPTTFWFLRRDFRGVHDGVDLLQRLQLLQHVPICRPGLRVSKRHIRRQIVPKPRVHMNILNRRSLFRIGHENLPHQILTLFAQRTRNLRRAAQHSLHHLMTTPGIFRILKRISPNQRHVQQHPARPHVTCLSIVRLHSGVHLGRDVRRRPDLRLWLRIKPTFTKPKIANLQRRRLVQIHQSVF